MKKLEVGDLPYRVSKFFELSDFCVYISMFCSLDLHLICILSLLIFAFLSETQITSLHDNTKYRKLTNTLSLF